MTSPTDVAMHSIGVRRTARYAMMGADVRSAAEVWLVCHGYGQLASRFIRRFEGVADGTRAIVAPEALSRFYLSGSTGPHTDEDRVGASWMTREERDSEIADQVTYLDTVIQRALAAGFAPPPRLVAFGFSQGAAVVCRWAARTATPPRDVVLWGSGVPADLFEGEGRAGLARARLTLVVGDSDPIADAARVESHRRQLDAAGLDYRLVRYEGGHEIDGEALAELVSGLGRG